MNKAACLASMVFWSLASPAIAAGSASIGYGAWNSGHHHGNFPPINRSVNCNYVDAGLHNGWGWDPYLGRSCPPQTGSASASNCNYDEAASNNGWGWDSVAGVSCAPLGDAGRPVSSCDFENAANNNGWGWDSVAGMSCPPA